MDNSFYGQLNVFQTIAQEGSISAAARKLEIAVPSASQALKLLEQKIGVPLFHRTTRNIQLTDVGRQLLERTEQAMVTLHQAFEEVRNFGGQVSGTVRITMARVMYQLVLGPHLKAWVLGGRLPTICSNSPTARILCLYCKSIGGSIRRCIFIICNTASGRKRCRR